MTNLTIRIEDNLKKKAAKQAKKLGISLTVIVKNALVNFVESATVTIGEVEQVIVDAATQKKMDKIGRLLAK